MALTLSKIAETATEITLGWTPPTNVYGYGFFSKGAWRSNGSARYDSGQDKGKLRDRVKFQKGQEPYEVAAHIYNGVGLVAVERAQYTSVPVPPDPPPPGTGFDIPTWQVSSRATTGEGNPEAFQSWLYYSYPTTPNPADWGGGPPLANFYTPQLDPVQGSWEWWWLYEVFIPTNWDHSTEGTMNALSLDAHNRPGDVGWDFQPGCASGVSSIHLRYKGGNLVLQHERQQDDNTGPNEYPIAPITKGAWHSVACHFILGRLDGSIPAAGHPNGGKGRTRVYLDGPLRLDTGDINILQRDKCTGQVQKKMSLLQGLYNGGMSAPHTAQITAARVGKTLAQALAMSTFNFQMVFYNNSGLNPDGSPRFHTWSQITPRTSAQFVNPQV